jgi:dethiobiotin synthetase
VRPRRLVVVTGTGTEIGKTWVSCRLLEAARAAGWTVAARKPGQSFDPDDATTDAAQLAAATAEAAEAVCPAERSYPAALAPPMAADVLGRPAPRLGELVEWVSASWPAEPVDLGLVEGAGGAASPLAVDGDTADLARRLGADAVVVVADAELGVISGVRLARLALADLEMVVHLNRFSPGRRLHDLNADWLRRRDGFVVTTDVTGLFSALGDPSRCG